MHIDIDGTIHIERPAEVIECRYKIAFTPRVYNCLIQLSDSLEKEYGYLLGHYRIEDNCWEILELVQIDKSILRTSHSFVAPCWECQNSIVFFQGLYKISPMVIGVYGDDLSLMRSLLEAITPEDDYGVLLDLKYKDDGLNPCVFFDVYASSRFDILNVSELYVGDRFVREHSLRMKRMHCAYADISTIRR